MRITPMNGFCVLRPCEADKSTKSGFLLPDKHEKQGEATVVSVATTNINRDGTDLPIGFKEGDRVIYNHYSGEGIMVDGEELRVIDISAVRGIIS